MDAAAHSRSMPHHAVIVGGGVAGLEALIALRSIAGDRVTVTLLSPDEEFSIRALSVEDPFARPGPRPYSVVTLCRQHGAEFHKTSVDAVNVEDRHVVTVDGRELAFDSLLVAVGARAVKPYEHGLTFRGMQDAEAVHGLIQDVEGGYIKRIGFVLPPGVTWPLPLYELALMTADRARSLGLDVSLTVVSAEPEPLGLFGGRASTEVARLLDDAGIDVVPGMHVRDVFDGNIVGAPNDFVLQADRVVVLPRLTGPRLLGLPCDRDGFVIVDDGFEVRGCPGIYAAGDGASFPIKQGGIAAQQGHTVAHAIARRAGAAVPEQPFRPTLRAELRTERHRTYLQQAIAGARGEAGSEVSEQPLWWPPTKVAAPYLAGYLAGVDTNADASDSSNRNSRLEVSEL